MMRTALSFALPFAFCATLGCGPKPAAKSGADANFDADAKSGPDGKRSSAREIQTNAAVTDEVSFANQDKTAWYQVKLNGKPGVMGVTIHWDNDASDVVVDVFDEIGKEIQNSP